MRTKLSDGTIAIRKYRRSDIPLLYAAARESAGGEFTRWMPWCHEEYSPEESAAFILTRGEAWEREEEYDFAIVDLKSRTYLGGIGLNQFNDSHHFANLGYWIRTSAMGRGIAPAAARLTARFAFEDLDLARVEIVVAVENVRSQRVAEKIGATREGILRSRLAIAGRRDDAVMYSLIPGDLQENAAAAQEES
jgi:RimJ/RimL family protein N-acetyltransferase